MKLTKARLKQIIKEEHNKFLKESQFASTASEEAEKVNAQTGISLVTDPEHWAEIGVHTGEDLAKSLLSSSYSDLYKSIHGIRPRHINFKDMSVEEIQQALDLLDEYEALVDEDELQYPSNDRGEAAETEEEELAPSEESYEEYDLPKQSGMGRGLRESAAELTISKLKQLIKEAGGDYDKEDSMGKLHRLLDAAREIRNMSPQALRALKNKIANEMDEDEYDFVMGLIQTLQHDPFYELD